MYPIISAYGIKEKRRRIKMRPTLLAMIVTMMSPAFAAAGHEGSNGGDVIFIRAGQLEAYIIDADGLKADLTRYLGRVKRLKSSESAVKRQIEYMIQNDVESDIKSSKYMPSAVCYEDIDNRKKLKSTSTHQGVKTDEICFNLPLLLEQKVLKSELIGLAAHEHARHFGFSDETPQGTHPLGAFVTKTSNIIFDGNLMNLVSERPGYLSGDIDLNKSSDIYLELKASSPECGVYGGILYSGHSDKVVGSIEIGTIKKISAKGLMPEEILYLTAEIGMSGFHGYPQGCQYTLKVSDSTQVEMAEFLFYEGPSYNESLSHAPAHSHYFNLRLRQVREL